MIPLQTICDALAAEINAAVRDDDWTGEVLTASRAYLHQFKTTDEPAFLATLAPGLKATERATRDKSATEADILCTFSKVLPLTEDVDASNALVDPLLKTVELLQEFFSDGHAITTLPNVTVADAVFEGGGVYVDEKLDEQNCFWAFLTIKVEGWD